MRSARHKPVRFHTYRQVHDRWMQDLADPDRGFVCAVALDWRASAAEIILEGEIGCRGNIVIGVRKVLEVLDGDGVNAIVQTISYRYNAHVRGHRCFLRCDNAHPHDGHETAHHRHEFDWKTEKDLPGSPTCTGNDWPTLGEFVLQAEAWYGAHRDELPEPDACPVLGLRE